MKKKILVSAILSIALCVSLIAGATFALFTSESKVNIAVTSGKVNVEASVSSFEAYSPKAISVDAGNAVADATNAADNSAEVKVFANGGTASLSGDTLSLNNITPGDKVDLGIKIENKSNVNVLYRYGYKVVAAEGGTIESAKKLYSGLVFKLDGVERKNYVSYYTRWSSYAADRTLDVEVKMPENAGNEYQGLSAKIVFTVEAVQGNAQVANEEEFEIECEIADSEGFKSALNDINTSTADSATIKLADDMSVSGDDEGVSVAADKNVTIDLAGKNLTVTNINTTHDGITVNSGATLTLGNSSDSGVYNFVSESSGNDCIFVNNEAEDKTATLNIDGNVEINVGARANSAIHAYAPKGNAVINMDGATVNINGNKQTSALVADQNSTVNMKNTVFNVSSDFDNYSDGNDVVGILLWGQNGKQENISVNIDEGTVINVGGKNAFAQGLQIGMKNGYSEALKVVMNAGKINLSATENGKGYAFTTYKDIYGSFVMNGGEISGNVTALALAYIGTTDLTIKGGTFAIDPTAYVDTAAYNVVKSATADIWTVTAK